MLFAAAHLQQEFNGPLHEDTRVLAIVLDALLKQLRWPELVITSVMRTAEENRRIYLPIAQELIRKHRAGEPLPERDKARAQTLAALKPADVEEWARAKFSWHLEGVCTAIDLRNTDPAHNATTPTRPRYPEPLTEAELHLLTVRYRLCLPPTATRHEAVEGWLHAKATQPTWELVTENHGTGPHWHVARRDFHRRIARGHP